MRSDDQAFDRNGSLGGGEAGFVLQNEDLLVCELRVCINGQLGLHNQTGNIFVPRNRGGKVVLQGHQMTDIGAEFAVGGIGGTTRPDTVVENLSPTLLATLQHFGDLPQNLRKFLRPFIKGVLIDLWPSARLQ
ncbi:hypothetical protein [Mycobacterium shottsii]|uniref:hypothetical protein n=1 Tax=Mycobacterium shottsii TaxID=133549 RepID=UPI003AEFF12B